MSKRAWIITVDHLADAGVGHTDAGLMGPRDVTASPEALKASGTPFRMYDDDGELYYSGFLIGDEFGPLDDYGRGGAGCTEIRVDRNRNGTWVTV